VCDAERTWARNRSKGVLIAFGVTTHPRPQSPSPKPFVPQVLRSASFEYASGYRSSPVFSIVVLVMPFVHMCPSRFRMMIASGSTATTDFPPW